MIKFEESYATRKKRKQNAESQHRRRIRVKGKSLLKRGAPQFFSQMK
jgi:hypothetical protein